MGRQYDPDAAQLRVQAEEALRAVPPAVRGNKSRNWATNASNRAVSRLPTTSCTAGC
jgi:hypothetical protein